MKLTRYICYLREHRLDAGLTQSQLASLVGCSKNAISSIERGEYMPSLILCYKLCDVLNCSPNMLFVLLFDGSPDYNKAVRDELFFICDEAGFVFNG